MKHKLKLFFTWALILCMLSGFSAPSTETVLAEELSVRAKPQLFTAYQDTFMFAYTDGKTHILKADGSASAVTSYPAQHVFLRGQNVITVTPMEDFSVAEYLNADSLTRTQLIGLELPDYDIFDLDADKFGRIYAVRFSTPDTLHIFDEVGSYAGSISFPTNILRIQVLDNHLFVVLPERCLCVALGQSLPQSYTEQFTYSASMVPFFMFTPSIYLTTNGIVCTSAGTPLTTTGHYALTDLALACSHNALFWSGNDGVVTRLDFLQESAAHFTMPDKVVALNDTAAVIHSGNQYILVPYGEFIPEATPTPVPTPEPTASSSPLPTAAPTASPTAVPSASPSMRPTASPTPSAAPSVRPTPTSAPSASPSVRPVLTPTPSTTPSERPTPIPTPSNTPSARPIPTPTPSASSSARPTLTPTLAASPTAIPSAAPKPSVNPTISPAPSLSPTPQPLPGVVIKDRYMYVPAGTTAAVLRKSLPYSETEIHTASAVRASGKIRTGWVVTTPNKRYTLIVPGDVNSSGTINSLDLRQIQKFLLGAQTPEELQILAGDLNGNNTLDVADLVLLVDLMQ